MKNYLFLTLCALLCLNTLIAQQVDKVRDQQDNHRIVLPIFNNAQLQQAENQRFEREGGPLTFAASHKTNITPKKDGNWQTRKDGNLSWIVTITSPNAYTLNLGFTQFYLPPSASLNIYSPKGEHLLGPLSQIDNDAHGQYWTPLFEGDEIILEIIIAPDFRNDLLLELGFVNHDFLGFGKSALSGSCNLDVVCGASDGWPEVDAYRDIIRSVGAYFFQSPNGTSICTGALINNVRQDCTPYFLTANHCGINNNNAASFVFVWNYENSTCRQPFSPESGQSGDGQKTEFNSGSILRASYPGSDMTLVELDDPINPEYRPFFAGWDARQALPESTICIHHPGVEEKRISFDFDPPVYDISYNDTSYVRVRDWDIGTTEGGSSGSPLFNSDKQIIGQLFGGQAACGNDLSDIYGWVYRSWEGGGTPSSRLKDWLDPEDQGIRVLDGRGCSFNLILSESFVSICTEVTDRYTIQITPNIEFEDTAMIQLINVPPGSAYQISLDQLAAGDTSTIELTDLDLVDSGFYPVIIQAVTDMGTNDFQFFIEIFDAVPGPPGLIQPAQDAMNESLEPVLQWQIENAQSSDIELASDDQFEEIVYSMENISETSLNSPQVLEPNTTYYWHVKSSNLCGSGEWSESFRFTTGNIRCYSFDATDVPIAIPEDQPATIQSDLFIPNGGVIKDLNVTHIIGEHTWINDLIFSLINPAGTERVLLSRLCEDEDNFYVGFDDESTLSEPPCPYVDGNLYNAIQDLAVFEEFSPRGHWTLKVRDDVQFDGGALNAWGLEICLDISEDFSVPYYPEDLTSCGNTFVESEIFTGAGFTDLVTFSAADDQEKILNFEPNPANPGDLVTITISGLTGLQNGNYSFDYNATDGTHSTTATVTVTIDNGPDAFNLVQPVDMAQNIDLIPTFSWEEAEGASDYSFELASDPEFQTLLETKIVQSNNYTTAISLEELTVYYWRVTGNNDCGTFRSLSYQFETTMKSSILELGGTQVNIFPNPADDQIHLFLESGLQGAFQVELIDVQGRSVIHKQFDELGYHRRIDVSELTPGLYFLKLSMEDQFATQRWVIY